MNRAVFLDRDGVLNDVILREGKPYPPASLAELRVSQGAPEALARLKAAGFLLIVVTNQPDVGRGTQSRESVEEIHRALARALPIDEFLVCWHDGREPCNCRKPKPGMVLDAAARHHIALGRSFLIGDRWRDVECGHSAGVRTVWIDRGYAERGPVQPPAFRCASITEAVDWIGQNLQLD
ncbi:MAG: HAD family hydrolase [Acidobacteriota bacterium]|nr:HAD family hydrolase [Acidobacteriota bacterium]